MRRRQKHQRSFQRPRSPPAKLSRNGLSILTDPGDGGTYNIGVTQDITLPGQAAPISIQNKDSEGKAITQTFEVQAPRWSLEAKDIHSTYPPQGHADDPRILPHVVLNDPHLPWERSVGEEDDGFNQVPWLAVLVFEPDELQVGQEVLQGRKLKVSPTRAISVTIQDILDTKNASVPIDSIDSTDISLDKATSTNAIFLKSSLFWPLWDLEPSGPPQINLQRYKYLAHVREVNSSGGAITNLGDENGLYSIVVSHRTGPLSNAVPKTVIAHLVSLDGLKENIHPTNIKDYVGLISLFSWQYQCLPPSSVDFPSQMESMGLQAAMLRPTGFDTVHDNPWLSARLANGYSMVRHRLANGETTVAFMRGPLSPVPVPYPILPSRAAGSGQDAGAWPSESFYSTDYQILDSDLGIADISYATAWQLGRAMAMADRSFSQALVNFRNEAHSMALAGAKAEYLGSKGSYKSRMDVLNGLHDLIAALSDVSNLDHLSTKKRSMRTTAAHVDLSLDNPELQVLYEQHLVMAVQKLTGVPLSSNDPGELKFETSSNWPVLIEWLLDRMKLLNLPAIYLVNMPENLPKESIRFFHLDQNWVAAQIDGALSVGNVLSRPDAEGPQTTLLDKVRQEIKAHFALYIKAAPNVAALCPNGGFFMRSTVVKSFPDLIITSANANTQVLSTWSLAEDVLVTWMRRSDSPNVKPSKTAIIISQPPHQQRFALGSSLKKDALIFPYNKVYTIPKDAPEGVWGATGVVDNFAPPHNPKGSNGTQLPIYDWDSRTIQVQNLADTVLKVLQAKMTVGFDLTTTLTSAVMALQLNDPVYQLRFEEPTSGEWGPSAMYGSHFKPIQAARASTVEAPKASLVTKPTKPVAAPSPVGISKGDTSLSVSDIRPPHVPPCPRLPPYMVSAGPISETSPPGFSSCLSLDVFANQPSRNPGGIPTSIYFLDIVFSLKPKNAKPGLKVRSISISFPVGSPSGNPGSVPILTQKYDGPGPIMLGNSRFNAVLSPTVSPGSRQTSLVITLSPRTMSDTVLFDSNPDFSCLLRQVAVDTTTTGSVAFTLTEQYILPSGSNATAQSSLSVAKVAS
ncbi:uncharacterized protein EI97DRAFT_503392 [Westerdykella ornata]|uniref:Uncharacterized protein n=1 Tax=Westerdykella ornata TaxID=318751 RepID=A0A6A6JB62_WESOR|nr:uncharacterized protein EI97DRAFT_503392 [Westerdykella ornata]KAF2273525.1 hypothetical protein EI97DRAFT_503392 [Westerdykella ornata]